MEIKKLKLAQHAIFFRYGMRMHSNNFAPGNRQEVAGNCTLRRRAVERLTSNAREARQG